MGAAGVADGKTIFLFSGQGSHHFQMGDALFRHHSVFRDWMLRLDDIATGLCGQSITAHLYGRRQAGELFAKTRLTHPAIFMVEYSLAQSLQRLGIWPDLVLGASLGAFAAAAIAGFLSVESALTAVIRQACMLEEHCQPGGMIAVLANAGLFVEDFLQHHSELAAVNLSSHFVVSTVESSLPEIEAALRRRAIACRRLPVSHAFHSQWIDSARLPFMSFAQTLELRRGRVPLICCEGGTVLERLPADYFWRIARNPIRFRDAVATAAGLGARHYIDVGPAGTLATFLKYELAVDSAVTCHSVLSAYGRDHENLTALLAARARCGAE